MHKRWCIISGPRTGSTYLESMIHAYWKKLDPTAISLSEPLHPKVGLNYPFEINPEGFLIRASKPIKKIRLFDLMQRVTDLILSANPDQPIVLRVFTQEEYYSEGQYFAFFAKLKSVGFKFISLDRDIFDQAMSLYFMETTGIVHRWADGQNDVLTNTEGEVIKSEPDELLHDIDEDKFVELFNYCEKYKLLREKICNKLPHIKVNYATIIEDCKLGQIPHSNVGIKRTYSKNYKDKVISESWKHIVSKYKTTNIKNTACQFAWDYPVLSLSRDELRNCCRAKNFKIADYDFAKGTDLFLKSTPLTKVKKELLAGIRSDACGACWAIENANGISPRSGFKNFARYVHQNLWNHLSIDEVKDKLQDLTPSEIEDICNIEKTRMIEISLGNTCDLKCVYCNHHYSSQWAAEKLKYKEIPAELMESELPKPGKNTQYETIFWDWFEQRSAFTTYYVNFIGGEPLIIDKFYEYSDKIIEFYKNYKTPQRAVHLGVVTNFNSPKKYLEKFKELTKKVMVSNKIYLDFNYSIEALGPRTEFIRTNSDWNLMVSNLENYLEFLNTFDDLNNRDDYSKVHVSLQIALNSLCISDLPSFFKFVIQIQKKYNIRIGLRQNQVMYPEWCSPHILPPSFSTYVDEAIEVINTMTEFNHNDYPDYGRWDSYIEFLKGIKSLIQNESKNNVARKAFAKNIDQLSIRRNLNFHTTFPEMVEFYNYCKNLR